MLEGYRLIYNYTLKFIKTREYNIHNKRIISEKESIERIERIKYLKEIRFQKKIYLIMKKCVLV